MSTAPLSWQTPFALSPRQKDLLDQARWLLGYALVVQTAFQYLLKAYSEVLEIVLFLTIVGGFVAATFLLQGGRGLLELVTKTWTQRLGALFLAALALTWLWGDDSPRTALALLRLPTYLIVIAIAVETLRDRQRLAPVGWTTLGAVCAIYAVALFEFFFGSSALGLECVDVSKCAKFKRDTWFWPGLNAYVWGIDDFTRHGGIFNATVTAEAYGMSRLGMFGLLAYAAGMAIVLTQKRRWFKALAIALVAFVLCSQILTGSRSATLAVIGLCGLFMVAVVLLPGARRYAKALAFANLAVFGAVGVFWLAVPPGITSLDRLLTPTTAGVDTKIVKGLAAGRAGFIRRSAQTLIGLRITGVSASEAHKVQLSIKGADASWGLLTPLVALPLLDGGASCGPEANDNNDECGDLVVTWVQPEDHRTAKYRYRLLRDGGSWGPWHDFIPQSRKRILRDVQAVAPDEDLVIVHYSGATVVDGWRTRNWRLAWDLFLDNPLGGNGFRTFQGEASARFVAPAPGSADNGPVIEIVGVHSGYLKVLAEAGLLGAVPFLGLLAFAMAMLARSDAGLSSSVTVWRIAYMAVFAAMLAINAMDTHSEDRFFWMTLAFAAVLETWRRERKRDVAPV